MHLETLPVVVSPATSPGLRGGATLTADASTLSVPDPTSAATESRSDRHEAAVRSCLGENPNLFRLVEREEGRHLSQVLYNGQPGRIARGSDGRLVCPDAVPVARTIETTPGVQVAAAPAEAPVAIAPSGSRTTAPAYARANESVVAIRDRFSGSGFFVEPASGPGGNPNRLIVTNAHVVENLQQGQTSLVTLADNSNRRARLVGFDPSGTDLALLTLEPSRYPQSGSAQRARIDLYRATAAAGGYSLSAAG
jgi:serine protease Do